MLLLLILPLWAAIATIAGQADEVTELARSVAHAGLPQPPDWVGRLPVVGAKLAAAWTQAADAGPDGLVARAAPYASDAARWAFGRVGSAGGMLVQFLHGGGLLRDPVRQWRRRRREASAVSAGAWRPSAARTP